MNYQIGLQIVLHGLNLPQVPNLREVIFLLEISERIPAAGSNPAG
jgi:hypothetical protein